MFARTGGIVSPERRKRQSPALELRARTRSSQEYNMKITMHTMMVEAATPALKTLSDLLDRGLAHAEAKKFDPSILANARLAPDMFPLTRQVQIACDMIKNGAARLAGLEAPRYEDSETTIEELKARIARTIDYVASIPASAFEGSEDRDIKIPLRDRTLEMKGLPFLRSWVIPNFWFHVVTTYALLRHNGVEIGKRDFLGNI
jgi:uncharacterized protein